MRHAFDPRINHPYIVWHDDPIFEGFVRHLIESAKPDRWVETGTHMGWTSYWVAKNYPHLPIYTAEIDPSYYELSRQNLAEFPQVSLSHCNSVDFLRRLLPLLKSGLSIFWLDAHWWPPIPLRDECKVVASLDRYVCLLDDFSCWRPDFSGDIYEGRLNDLSYTADILGTDCYRPDYESRPGYKGYGLFLKNVDYVPPSCMKRETMPVEEIHERGIRSQREGA
jgi:hypothetical protein